MFMHFYLHVHIHFRVILRKIMLSSNIINMLGKPLVLEKTPLKTFNVVSIHKSYHFKMYSSVALSTFTLLYNHQSLELVYLPKLKLNIH